MRRSAPCVAKTGTRREGGLRVEISAIFLELARLPNAARVRARRGRSRSPRYLRDLGLAVDEDDAGPPIGSTPATSTAGSSRTARGGHADLPLRAPRHRPAGGPDRAVGRGGHRPQRGGHDPRRGRQVRGRGRCSRPRPRSSREGRPHAGVELLFTPKEEVGLQGAKAFDHTRLAAEHRLRLRPGRADRRDRARRADAALARPSASTGARRTRACTRRTGARPSPPPRGPSPTCGSGASTRRRARTSGSFRAGRRATSSPSGAS